jgi:putative peptidoglycan lipid II flippase
VLIASARASFQSRGDTKTPMTIALVALAANVALKIALFRPLGAVGLATATSVGLWINLAALVGIALQRHAMRFDATFWKVTASTGVASLALAFLAVFGARPFFAFGAHFGRFADLVTLLTLGAAGAAVYAAALFAELGLAGISLRKLRRAGSAPAVGEGEALEQKL